MTDYFSVIWLAIQEQARSALAALDAHLGHYMVVYPTQDLTRIRDGALDDPQIARPVRDFLSAFAGPSAYDTDADLCPWQTSGALEALQVLAASRDPDEALAMVGPTPDTAFLEAWVEDLQLLPEAIRRRGPRKDPGDVLRELYHESQRETRRAMISYLARGLGSLAETLHDDERKRFDDALERLHEAV
jgi:hypothetical protein